MVTTQWHGRNLRKDRKRRAGELLCARRARHFTSAQWRCADAVVSSNKNRQQKSPGRNPGLDAKRSPENLPPTAAELVVHTGGDDVDGAVTGADRRDGRIAERPRLVGQADIVVFGSR